MIPRALPSLWAAMDFAEAVGHRLAGRSRSDYESNRMLQDAVLYSLDKSSRGMARSIEYEPDLTAHLPDVGHMLELSQVLLSRYWDIDHDEVWHVTTSVIPKLIPSLRKILSTHGQVSA